MEIQLFSLAEHTPEGFKSINTFNGVLPSSTIILYAETIEKALAFLRAYPARPRGVIVTPGESFNSSPASASFWHIAIPENNMSAVKSIAQCYLDTFGCENIPSSDSYEALQSRFSDLLLETVENRRSEETFRKNETEHKKIQTLANVGSWKWNLQTGKVKLSAELCRIYSIPEQKEYSDITDFIDAYTHPDDIMDVKKAAENAFKGYGSKALIFRIIRPDGEIRFIAAPEPEVIKMDDRNNPVEIFGIQQDITDQKKAEDELLQSEHQLGETARNIPGIIFQFYIRKSGEYGIDFVSGNLESIFGIPEDTENLFESFVQGIPSKEQKEEFFSSIDSAVSSMEDWNFETPFLRSSGEMIHVRGISKPTLLNNVVLFNGIMLDVTEQKNASQRVADLNSLLLAIRNVNQLIVQETGLEGLLQNACETLIETRSYQDCTIMLLDDEGKIGEVFQAGTKSYLKDELILGPYPVCVAQAIDTGNYVIMNDPDQCKGCDHLGKHGKDFYPTFVAPMKSEDRTVGILFVALSYESTIDAEEGALLQEVTDDIAFAMGKLDAESKLIKSEERYRKLFDSSHDAIMTLEPPAWKFASGNPSILGMFCVSSEEEFTTMGPWNLSPRYQPDGQLSSDKAKQMIGIAMREGSHFFEWIHRRLSGEDFSATVLLTRVDMPENTFLQATVRDITDRKKTELELNHLRNYLANIIDSMPSVLIGVSTENKITLWNSEAEHRTGLSAKKAFGRKLSDVIPWLSEHSSLISDSISSREVKYKARQNTSTDDENRYEDLTVYPLIANNVEGAVLRIDDVTERVRLEEMMVQSEKMLSVGGLAAGMAHEINNPLAGMMQNSEVILRRLTGDLPDNDRIAAEVGTTMEVIRSFLEKRNILHQLHLIHDSGRRAASIVQNMLSFARKSEAKPSLFDVAELLDKTLELAQNDYDLKKKYDFRHIEIRREYEKSLPMILCERSKIQQVFLNILRNGTEAMWNSKSRTGKPKKPRFILKITAEDNFVVTEIEDNGPGIPANIRKRIFEPFFTTKEVGIGTGLGLSVSYFIVTEGHGGELEVKSVPGRHTRFIIRLPIGSDDS